MEYRTIRPALRPTEPEARVAGPPPPLDAHEVRVLGALVEKAATTPDYYPMTLNGLTAACNQKTSRDPVVDYSDAEVQDALGRLQAKGLTRRITSADGRVPRYRHVFHETFGLTEEQGAALAALMLRGPQTVGEIRQRAQRIFPFEAVSDAEEALERLAAKNLAVRLERQPGEKEPRYAHLLSGEPVEVPRAAQPAAASRTPLEERVAELEQEVEALRARLERLEKELQFEPGEEPSTR